MRRMLFGLVVAGVLLSPTSARADLNDATMVVWKRVAESCGRDQQVLNHLGLQHLVDGLREETLQHARAQGASEEQITILDGEYEDGLTRDILFFDHLKLTDENRTYYENVAKSNWKYCTERDYRR